VAPRFGPTLDWAIENRLATCDAQGTIRLTTTGRLLSNEVFERLL